MEAQILAPAWQVLSREVITQLALLAVKLLLLVIENPSPSLSLTHAQIQNLITRDRREGLERATLGARRWLSQLCVVLSLTCAHARDS